MDDLHAIYDGPKAFKDAVESMYTQVRSSLIRTDDPIVIAGRAGMGPQYGKDVMGPRTGEMWQINVWRLVRHLILGNPESALSEIRKLMEEGDGTRSIKNEGLNYRTAFYHPILDAIVASPEAMALAIARQPISLKDPEDRYKLGMVADNVPYDLAEAFIRWEFGNTEYNQALQCGASIEEGAMKGKSIAEVKVKMEIEDLEIIVASLAARRLWNQKRHTIKPYNKVIGALQGELDQRSVREFLQCARELAEESFAQQLPMTKILIPASNIN